MRLFAVLGVMIFTCWLCSWSFQANTKLEAKNASVNNFPVFGSPTFPASQKIVVTVNVRVSFPTLSNTPTATSTPQRQIERAGYSYYNPDLGGVNCYVGNWSGKCADVTSSGFRWRGYLYHAAALSPEWLAVLGYGSVISVISPQSISGDYTVIDMCNGFSGFRWADGVTRIDFLDTVQRLAWDYPIEFYVKFYILVASPSSVVPKSTPIIGGLLR